MRAPALLTITTLTVSLAFSSSAAARTVVPVDPFDSIEVQDGGHVLVRQGTPQRVTLVRGDLRGTRIAVDGRRLVIDSYETHRHGDRLEIEVVTPELAAVSVS